MSLDALDAAARRVLGPARLREQQRDAIAAVLAGRDVLAVLATGFGKSAIYQVAGLLLDGPTVVVSPLVALQRDQVQSLRDERGIDAFALNSSDRAEAAAGLEAVEAGREPFVLVSPEQLARPELVARLRAAKPGLLVVDEAHLVVEWGHDFRPDYLTLGRVAEALGRPPVLALTATAGPEVRTELVARLGLRSPLVVVGGFDRPNIDLAVEGHLPDEATKRRAVVERVARSEGAGLVYAATRSATEELASDLRSRKVAAAAYHAGMTPARRERVQDRFMAGRLRVVVATVAFGMGIDKADVRWVVHAHVSRSLDEYAQEVGRAGRDGEPAAATLYYRPADLRLPRFFAAGAGGSTGDVAAIVVALAETGASAPVPRTALAEQLGFGERRLSRGLAHLVDAGLVLDEPGGDVRPRPGWCSTEDAVERAMASVEAFRAAQVARVETMRAYAEELGCRRQFLLDHFGEPFQGPCGRCDNDRRAEERARRAAEEVVPFPSGAMVRHRVWGQGRVIGTHRGRILVDFGDNGFRHLRTSQVLAEDSLEPVGD